MEVPADNDPVSISSAFSGGFYKAPLSRLAVYGSLTGFVLMNFPLQKYQPLLECNYVNIIAHREVWRLPLSKLVVTDAKNLILLIVLIFHFKKFEKRQGTRRFAGSILGVFLLSLLMEFSLLYGAKKYNYQLDDLPTGPLAVVFSMFVPFFVDIPRVTRATVLGIPISGKAIAYISGLHFASGSMESLLLAAVGLVAGSLHRFNFGYIKSWCVIPKPISSLCAKLFSSVLEVPAPTMPSSYGATVELQRIEAEERLEQSLLLANLRAQRHQRHNQGGRLGGLAHWLGAAGGGDHAAVEPSDDQIQRLTAMGFSRDRAVEALRLCGNDLTQATNHLLLHVQ